MLRATQFRLLILAVLAGQALPSLAAGGGLRVAGQGRSAAAAQRGRSTRSSRVRTATSLRKARPADASAISQIQADVWNSTYEKILPRTVLARLRETTAQRSLTFRSFMKQPQNGAFVSTVGGEVVGFAFAGPLRTEDGKAEPGSGETYALYISDKVQGQGLGRALLVKSARFLRRAGYTKMKLWALSDNASGRGFYERMGGRIVGERNITIDSKQYGEVAYEWSIDALLSAR